MRRTVFTGFLLVGVLCLLFSQNVASTNILSDLIVKRSFTFTCTLLDRDGNPLPDQNIKLKFLNPGKHDTAIQAFFEKNPKFGLQDLENKDFPGMTNKDGKCMIKLLNPGGIYSLEVSGGHVPNTPDEYNFEKKEVNIDSENNHITLRLKNIHLTGKIMNLDGDPVAGAKITTDKYRTMDREGWLIDETDNLYSRRELTSTAITDDKGEFRLVIFPGKVRLKVEPTSSDLIPVSMDVIATEDKSLLIPSCKAEMKIARKYAPIIWLADDETLYPMMPHPFAFDGIDNDLDDRVDLMDKDEVEMGDLDYGKSREKIESLRTGEENIGIREKGSYSSSLNDGIFPKKLLNGIKAKDPSAELDHYVVRRKGEKLWEIIVYGIKDGKYCASGKKYIVREYESDTSVHLQLLPPARVAYHRDMSKAAHKGNEWEYPIHQYWLYYLFDEGLEGHKDDSEHVFVFSDSEGKVKGIVGSGHNPFNANNILVTGDPLKSDMKFPRKLPENMPILVELGKHASAPDRNMNGRFDLGMDANLFPDYVWGSRDISSSTDTIRAGAFKQEYSYPREKKRIFPEQSSWDGESYRKAYLNVLNDLTIEGVYALFPLDDMSELYRMLTELKGIKKTGSEYEKKKSELEEFLFHHRYHFWGEDAPDEVVINDDILQSMINWTNKQDSKQEMWLHSDHETPNDIFKRWLFPSWSLILPRLRWVPGKWGYGIVGFGVQRSHSKYVLSRRGSIGIHYNYNFAEKMTEDISLVLDIMRGTNMGYYLGLGWGDFDLTSWEKTKENNCAVASGGVIFSLPFKYFGFILRLGLRGEIHNSEPWRLDPVNLELSVSFVPPLRTEKRHPLTY